MIAAQTRLQKQSPEVFCKKKGVLENFAELKLQKQSLVDVLQKMFLKILRDFYSKTSILRCFLIKLQVFRPVTILKKDSKTGVFL